MPTLKNELFGPSIYCGPNSPLVTSTAKAHHIDPSEVSFLVPDLPRTKPQNRRHVAEDAGEEVAETPGKREYSKDL